MGRDKALLLFAGRPMVAIAVATLRQFCSEVAIAGNREDLLEFAPVIPEALSDAGPVAGLQAGLEASPDPWSLFMPVDVPLAPAELLARWAEAVLTKERDGVRVSYLRSGGKAQPAFCMLHKECLPALAAAIDGGMRRLESAFGAIQEALGTASLWVAEAEELLGPEQVQEPDTGAAFANVNWPEDLTALELRWTTGRGFGPARDEGMSHG